MRKFLLLLFVLLILAFICPLQIVDAGQGDLLGVPFYLRRTSANTYKNAISQPPSNATPITISRTSNSSEVYYIDGWTTPSFETEQYIPTNYSFKFSMWGYGTTINCKFLAELYVYPWFEYPFLQAYSESFATSGYFEMLWQKRTTQTVYIPPGNKILLKLYFNVTGAGTYYFRYDSTGYPSYFYDPIESRYMRNDQWTVNGLTAYKLWITQSSGNPLIIERYDDSYSAVDSKWCIDVVKRTSGSSETVIGSKVAVVTRTSLGFGMQSATWDCPQTALSVTDSIVIKVYQKWSFESSYSLLRTFTTEQLGSSQLDAYTWTVYYWTAWSDDGMEYVAVFEHGISTFNSRIEGFKYTVPTTKTIYIDLSFSPTISLTNYLKGTMNLNPSFSPTITFAKSLKSAMNINPLFTPNLSLSITLTEIGYIITSNFIVNSSFSTIINMVSNIPLQFITSSSFIIMVSSAIFEVYMIPYWLFLFGVIAFTIFIGYNILHRKS